MALVPQLLNTHSPGCQVLSPEKISIDEAYRIYGELIEIFSGPGDGVLACGYLGVAVLATRSQAWNLITRTKWVISSSK